MALHKATDGPLAGHTVADVDMVRFGEYGSTCEAIPIGYGWGCKPYKPLEQQSPLSEHPPRFMDCLDKFGGGLVKLSDCSGFADGVLKHADPIAFGNFPEGSAEQAAWFEENEFKRSDSSAICQVHANYGVLYACIHEADDRDGTGHIFFAVCRKGEPPHTWESYGGHGVGRRSPDVMLSCGYRLADLADHVYAICLIPD